MTIRLDNDGVLKFLKTNPIIPPENEISDELYDNYMGILEYISENPNNECIPLIVNSFRSTSSPFFQQGFTDVLLKLNQNEVIKYIIYSLNSKDYLIKESAAFFASQIPSDRLIDSLVNILRDNESSDESINYTVDALESISKIYKNINVESIIDIEFTKNVSWNHILEQRNKFNFAKSFIEVNWDASQALKNGDYSAVVKMLEPYDGNCPAAVQKKLDTARKIIQQKNAS